MVKREIYDPDQQSFRASERSFWDRAVRPNKNQYIEAKQLPREMRLAFGRHGLLGLVIPEQYGGSAAGNFRYKAVLGEERGTVSMSLSSCHGIDADVVARRPGRVGRAAAPRGALGSMDER
jgi:alkylation response protein AidB-like acyl-CoA dehydrogenase